MVTSTALAEVDHPGGPARLVFLGSPEIAVSPLRALVAAGHDVALVVTNPDKRRARGAKIAPTPVKAAALELGLEVTHSLDAVAQAGASLGIVVAYGHYIPEHLLETVPMVNIHFSLLPRWRGAAPLEWAILAGDDKTGACLMQVSRGFDEGGVFARVEVPIGAAGIDELRRDLVEASCQMLISALEDPMSNPAPQRGQPTYARKLTTQDFRLDFSRPAVELERLVRLGRAFTTLGDRRLGVLGAAVVGEPCPKGDVGRVAGSRQSERSEGADPGIEPGILDGTRVATGQGWLELLRVKPEGKAAIEATAWVNGARLGPEARLGV